MSKFLDGNGLRYLWGKLRAAVELKQDRLTGQPGQVVGFDADGNAAALDPEDFVGPAVDPGDMQREVYDPQNKAQDIFAYADQKMPKSGGAFTGAVSGVSPTSGAAKGFRNIYFGSGSPASGLGADGDIYFNIG